MVGSAMTTWCFCLAKEGARKGAEESRADYTRRLWITQTSTALVWGLACNHFSGLENSLGGAGVVVVVGSPVKVSVRPVQFLLFDSFRHELFDERWQKHSNGASEVSTKRKHAQRIESTSFCLILSIYTLGWLAARGLGLASTKQCSQPCAYSAAILPQRIWRQVQDSL